MNMTKIRNKMLIVLIPLFLVSFVAMMGISFYQSRSALNQESANLTQAISDKYSLMVDEVIEAKALHLETLADSATVRSLNEPQILELMKAEKNRFKDYTALFFINLRDPAHNYGLNTSGKQFDYRTRSYTKHILANKKTYVSDPSVSATTGKLSVMIVTPVKNGSNMVGFIGGTISLDALTDMVSQVKLHDTGYGFIVSNDGLILAHPKQKELIGKTNLKDLPDPALASAFAKSMESNAPTAFTFSSNGTAMSALFTPIQFEGNRWAICTAVPTSEQNADSNKLGYILLTISIICLVIAVMIVIAFAKKISDPLVYILGEYNILNSGDLRPREMKIDSEDEIGQLAKGFVTMRTTLAALIKKTQTQAELVAATSEELTASANQSSEASEHVAISITDIAEGADKQSSQSTASAGVAREMSTSANDISAKASEVKSIAEAANNEVETGRNEIAKVVVQMNKIEAGSDNVEASINQLAQCSKEISSMVELISNIAGQTNLLSLNAAIEAARAGEHGKGFSVVAEEVRKLAEESNQASQHIAELVVKNQADMEVAIKATKESSEGVKLGMVAVNSADDTFKNIVDAIAELSAHITDISTSINQMVSHCASVLDAVESIDEISKSNAGNCQSVSAATQQQAASMKEIAQASHSLATLASELQEEVIKFKV